MMREGWLIDRDDFWIWRFHRDEKAWIQAPKALVDRDGTTHDAPPLLKERRYLRKQPADLLWQSLQSQGWKRSQTRAWDVAVEFCHPRLEERIHQPFSDGVLSLTNNS
jgi:hypothetical protein